MPYCQRCGAFAGEERWRKWCKGCYALSKREEEQALQDRVWSLERQLRDARQMLVEARRAPAASRHNGHLAPERVRELLMLCHPDRHGGSHLANRITQWLLTLAR